MSRPPDWDALLAGLFLVAIDPAAFGDPEDYQRRWPATPSGQAGAGASEMASRSPPRPG